MLPGSSWCCRVTSNSPDDLGTSLFTFPSPSPRGVNSSGRTECYHCCTPAWPWSRAHSQHVLVPVSGRGSRGRLSRSDLSANCWDVKVLDWLSSKGEPWKAPFYLGTVLSTLSSVSVVHLPCEASQWVFPLTGTAGQESVISARLCFIHNSEGESSCSRVPALCPSCAGLSQRKESLSLGLLPWIPYTCGDQIL